MKATRYYPHLKYKIIPTTAAVDGIKAGTLPIALKSCFGCVANKPALLHELAKRLGLKPSDYRVVQNPRPLQLRKQRREQIQLN